MGKFGQKRVREAFAWEVKAWQLADLYGKICLVEENLNARANKQLT